MRSVRKKISIVESEMQKFRRRRNFYFSKTRETQFNETYFNILLLVYKYTIFRQLDNNHLSALPVGIFDNQIYLAEL